MLYLKRTPPDNQYFKSSMQIFNNKYNRESITLCIGGVCRVEQPVKMVKSPFGDPYPLHPEKDGKENIYSK